jgi:hypothetical protein
MMDTHMHMGRVGRLVAWPLGFFFLPMPTGREYAAADARWGTADPTVVSLELLTVLGAGPLAALIVYQIVKRDPARHYWIVVLSTAELYGGCVLFPFFTSFAGCKSRVGVDDDGWEEADLFPFFFLMIAG